MTAPITSNGLKAQGSATIGTSAVKVRSATGDRLSFMAKNTGPGNLFFGNSSVTTGNTPPVPSGGYIVLDHSMDDIWAVADQANTGLVFLEETT